MPDYVIVGAGTAGCVLANALSENPKTTVTLLEAGTKPNSLFVRIPAGMPRLFKSKLDWAYQSEPQAGLNGRSVFIPRGKMLGGSANMNAQIHQWCHPRDFDGWQEQGARAWGWTHVAPVFRRMECWAGARTDDQSRGALGPMVVSRLVEPNPLSVAFVEAARAAGINGEDDYNGGAYRGAWLSQVAHANGARFSAYDALLKPALRRPNLSTRTQAHVKRILFDGKRAAGVVVEQGGRDETITADRGVVVAAGAYGSPQLLLLSGVGPGATLQQHGIAVTHEASQVGANLQEHPFTPVLFRAKRPITLKNAGSIGALLNWIIFRRGPLSSNVAEAMAFTSTQGADEAPDLELCFGPVQWQNEALTPPTEHACGFGVVMLTPRSRGSVRLKSADWRDAPAIDLGLFTDTQGFDIGVQTAGVRLGRRIAATAPLAGELAEEMAPGAGVTRDDEIAHFLRQNAQTIYHPVGTARMGEDADAVVDSRLRVRGLDKLWVADASVMPTVPRGHPNAVVAMIAARAAEFVTAAH